MTSPSPPKTTTADRVAATVYADRPVWLTVKIRTAKRGVAASALVNAYLERFVQLGEDDPEVEDMLDRAARVQRERAARGLSPQAG